MKRTLFALAFAAALPMSAQAAERSYSYVELDYVNVDSNADGSPRFISHCHETPYHTNIVFGSFYRSN